MIFTRKNYFLLPALTLIAFMAPLKNDASAAIGVCPCAVPLTYATNVLHPNTEKHISAGFADFQVWMLATLYQQHLLPALKSQTAQLATVTKQQEAQIGKFHDASHEKQVARTIASARADTHTEFTTSTQLCKTATQTRSLNASADNAKLSLSAIVARVDQRAQIRGDVISASQNTDNISRLAHYRSTYVNPNDNGGGLGELASSPASVERRNGDLGARIFDSRATLDLDFSDSSTTDDEEDFLATMANFFPTTQMKIPEAYLMDGSGNVKPEAAAVVAKQRQIHLCRNIAATALAYGPSRKSKGAGEVAENFHAMKEEQGIDKTASIEANGEFPSYDAQIDNISTMYENPSEQIALTGQGKANISRQQVGAEALELKALYDQQERTSLKEMNMLCKLALRLEKEKDALANEINQLSQQGTTL